MRSSDNISRDVIAKYASSKAIISLLFLFGIYPILAASWYSPTEPILYHVIHHGIFRAYATIVGSIFALILLPMLLRALWQVLFDGLRAIWIVNGTLVYMNRHFFSVKCAEIISVSTGLIDRYGQIGLILRLRSGQEKLLPARLLSEPANVIADRLKDKLGC